MLSLPALPRRSFILQTCLLSTSTLDLNRSSSPIVLPLTYQPILEAYTLNFSLEGSSQNFTGVVDTGSPFLTVAAPHRAANPNDGEICGSSYFPFGCYRGEGEVDPELGDTVEQFGSLQGKVIWRRGNLTLDDHLFPRVAFGAVDASLLSSSNGGAVFFGTVKRIAKGIRPSLLSEIDAVAFRLSLSSPSETSLTIYPRSSQTSPSFPSSPPLKFSDLRRYGSPVQHYAAKVKTLLLDGVPATLDRPTYAIIDSGCTGLLLSESMYSQGKFNGPPAVLRTPRSVTVEFANNLKLTAGGKGKGRSSFLALPVPIPWFGERGVARPETAPIHVMSLGLVFFNSSDVIIDTEQMRGWIT